MIDQFAVAALICACAVVSTLAGRDLALNSRIDPDDHFKAVAHLKCRVGTIAAAATAPLLTLVSWPGALFALAVAVFCLFVPPNRVLIEPTTTRPTTSKPAREQR